LVDFLAYRTMLTPFLIQLLFWLGTATCAVAISVPVTGYLSLKRGSPWTIEDVSAVLAGIVTLFIAMILLRLLCESLILFYRMNETLTEILHENQKQDRRR
jgi:hypothetical protein